MIVYFPSRHVQTVVRFVMALIPTNVKSTAYGYVSSDKKEEESSASAPSLQLESSSREASTAAVRFHSVRVSKDFAKRYKRDGFVFPIRALNELEVAAALAGFKRWEHYHVKQVSPPDVHVQNHLWLPWIMDIARHPAILGAVSVAFKSENILLYNTALYARLPGKSLVTQMGLGWHTDGHQLFSRLEPMDRVHYVTAFVALTQCDQEHGCVRMRPTRVGGRACDEEVDVELCPGEFSLHGPSTLHTGILNTSNETRYCVALRYIRASTRDTWADHRGRDCAILVSGEDKKNFELIEPVPEEATEKGRLLREAIVKRRGFGPASWPSHGELCG